MCCLVYSCDMGLSKETDGLTAQILLFERSDKKYCNGLVKGQGESATSLTKLSCCEQGLNLQPLGYEPSTVPHSHLDPSAASLVHSELQKLLIPHAVNYVQHCW